MRTIKFRGKRLGTQEWVEGYYWHNIQDDRHNIVISVPVKCLVSEQMQENAQVDAETVGQFTGLADKNGKEIFEGDILLPLYNHIKPFDVRFNNGNFNCADYAIKSCEVIGNIHEIQI